MTPENFCYWLQGFVELHKRVPTEKEWDSITEHLQLVFKKATKPLPGYIPPSAVPYINPFEFEKEIYPKITC